MLLLGPHLQLYITKKMMTKIPEDTGGDGKIIIKFTWPNVQVQIKRITTD